MVVRRRRDAAAPAAASVADTVLRLAVLLQAGIPPAGAWRHLAESGDSAAQGVVGRVGAGRTLPDAIVGAGGAWSEVAAAWDVATSVGAPLADSLRGLAEALRDAHEAADDVRIALAEPAGSARLMLWLPLAGVALGTALGFDTFATLVGSPFGWGCLAGGLGLLFLAQRWTRSLVRKAQPPNEVPGLHAELVAIALSGGVSVERARRLVADAPGAPDSAGSDTGAILALSRSAGVPAVELLRASAATARHRARTDGRLRASRLASRLLLPLGVCTLPAFLLLGVAPMMLSVLTTTPLPF
ncbi:MAG TPA: type II secretion system F family protein [Microbacterium sp.]|uniref:type II secretion system F family protein n=1 Tax=Microbacterium sp. TaxID=51671 RepID=UPI002C6F98B0|nr:type II secretion system F family protein [Microbacterium sp.]HWI32031.1 type II secretion system F family protein [Microbacterium sp.]